MFCARLPDRQTISQMVLKANNSKPASAIIYKEQVKRHRSRKQSVFLATEIGSSTLAEGQRVA